MKKKYIGILIIISLIVAGCTVNPVPAFQLNEVSLSLRDKQSRVFRNISEQRLLSASVVSIQEMGYRIRSSQTELGLITASKKVMAINDAQVALYLSALIFLQSDSIAIDNSQEFLTTIVVLPSSEENVYIVRMSMQYIRRNTDGHITHFGLVHSPKVYSHFFESLSKAILLKEKI